MRSLSLGRRSAQRLVLLFVFVSSFPELVRSDTFQDPESSSLLHGHRSSSVVTRQPRGDHDENLLQQHPPARMTWAAADRGPDSRSELEDLVQWLSQQPHIPLLVKQMAAPEVIHEESAASAATFEEGAGIINDGRRLQQLRFSLPASSTAMRSGKGSTAETASAAGLSPEAPKAAGHAVVEAGSPTLTVGSQAGAVSLPADHAGVGALARSTATGSVDWWELALPMGLAGLLLAFALAAMIYFRETRRGPSEKPEQNQAAETVQWSHRLDVQSDEDWLAGHQADLQLLM
ncbi:hypothetical protein WJX84_002830 [Apatococcus fuscideae]|uniref:Transmembrane protein n=1 Tax=Apatococcus fuscideae TaxID=2026836 RepID=A0AAW1T8E5_9CHLO